jgi:hypothetical protein
MVRKIPIVTYVLLLIWALVACNQNKLDRMPGITLPLKDMNSDLQLSAPQELNTFKMSDNLRLILSNSSNNPIILPQDYGAQIFEKTAESWEILENRFDYPPGEKGVNPRDDQPSREVVLVVHPLVFSEQPVTVRIVVVGNYYDEASGTKGKQVGAFIDITLEPK